MKKCKQMIKLIEKNLIQVYKKEITKAQVAENLGVFRPTIYEWIRKYEGDGVICIKIFLIGIILFFILKRYSILSIEEQGIFFGMLVYSENLQENLGIMRSSLN